MAELFHLDVVTPERSLLSRNVEEIIAPGSQGEFGVFKGHAAFLTTLKPGMVTVYDDEGGKSYMAISGGFCEVTSDKVILLAEHAELAKEIDLEQTRKDLEIAEEKLRSLAKDDPEVNKWESRKIMAEVKIKVAETVKAS
ncbi:MAG TPA: ATP synthase F1 subunit epsilon [Desulfomonilia bacterium]|jgi:F-type H+-transporting ATPase subunit epsilon